MAIETIDRRLAKIIRWSFVGLLFFLPLILSTRSSEVFELPKILFGYAATAVIVGSWLSRMVVRREILIRQTPLDIPILLFLISQMASTIYSIDPAVSWWGWYGRFHGGLISTISYTLLYYALVSNVGKIRNPNIEIRNKSQKPNDKNLKRPVSNIGISNFEFVSNFGFRVSNLILVILASALVVSAYALLQHFGVDKDFWVQDVVNRVFSTQGQPNWLAAYIVMAIPLTFAMTISEIINQKSYSPSLRWNTKYMISYFLFMIYFLALLWTKSRSGLLGLAAADAVFWLAMLAKLKVKSEKLKVARRFVLIHALMAGLILATNNPAREWILERLQVTGYRLQTTTIPAMESGITLRKSEHGGTESGDIRRIVWGGAIQLVKQRPLVGFGPETFGETYWRVRPKEHNYTSEWNFLYNKAHNEWLNLAANTGLFGLGSHILIIFWFGVWIIHQLKIRNPKSEIRNNDQNSNDKNSKLRVSNFRISNLKFVSNFEIRASDLTTAALLAAVVGVEAVNFFGFSTVTVGVYQYLFMGLAVVVGNSNSKMLLKSIRDREESRDIRQRSNFIPYFLFTVIIVTVLYLIAQLFIFFLADLSYNRGRAYQDAGYIEEAVEPLMQAVNLAPEEPVFRAELAEALSAVALKYQISNIKYQKQEDEDNMLLIQFRDEAIKNFEIVRKQSPQNLGFVRTDARVLFLLGEYDQAVQLMKLGIQMAPTNPQLPYSLGQMLTKMGNEAEAAVYYNKAVELKPDYPAIPSL